MGGREAILRSATAALAAVAFTFAGCGGSGRQEADDEAGTYTVSVADVDFPARQDLAEESTFTITVKNTGEETIPNLTATISGEGDGTEAPAFGTLSDLPGVSARARPAWIVDESPGNGETAYVNTWALGPLAAGETHDFTWRLTAIKPGSYRLGYRLAGSLGGNARVQLAGGEPAHGSLDARIDRRPGQARVTPDGEIVRVPAQ